MAGFDDALGLGPDGVTYSDPVPRERSTADNAKGWLWYRWGFGHRPRPKYDSGSDDRRGRRSSSAG